MAMFDAFYISATGLDAHRTQLDAISQNVANLNTTGYRRKAVTFSTVSAAATDPITQAVRTSLGSQGGGTVAQVRMSSSAGELKQTSEALDIAIDGAGYLEVVRADGTPAYTRAGTLKVNADGLLSTGDGLPLAQRIAVPPDAQAIRIDADGRIFAALGADETATELGRIELVSFANPSGMQSIGGNLYAATAQSGEPQAGMPTENGLGQIRQGYLESSNVQLIEEMVAMMVAQRGFELASRVAQAADQMAAITNSLRRE